MKHPDHLKMRSMLLACCLAAAYPAHAEETSTTTTTTTATTSSSTTTTAIGTSANTEAKLTAEFAEFLGGPEQASAVVSGLRQGTAFSLDALVPTPVDSTTASGTTGTTSTSTTTTITTIDPPTGTMGYGNVRITLRLAEAQLNQMGITQPTTEELAAVLIGGEIDGTQVDGILTLRADGMGWGQIAKEYGMTVGQLMGKGGGLTKPAPTPTPYAQTKASGKASQVSGGSTPSGKAHANGYIPSSPKTMPASSARSNGYIPSGKANGAGVVTAAGGSAGGSANAGGKGQSNKITSSGGQQVSMSGVSTAGGGAGATAPGQVKKN